MDWDLQILEEIEEIEKEKLKESILDPVHKTLDSQIWTSDNKLIPKVKKEILDFTNEFLQKNYIKADRIILTGSIATYQYSPEADIDINVSVGISKDKLDKIKKKLEDYNGKLLTGTKHSMNLFIFKEKWIPGLRGPSYDLDEDSWEVKPVKDPGNIPYKMVLELALSWARKIDLDIGEFERDLSEYKIFNYHLDIIDQLEGLDAKEVQEYIELKANEIRADLDTLKIDLVTLKNFRQEPFKEKEDVKEQEEKIKWLVNVTGPNVNYTINNVLYKLLEKFGYLDKLHKYVNSDLRSKWIDEGGG